MSPYSILGSNFLSCTRKRHVKHTDNSTPITCYICYMYLQKQRATHAFVIIYIYNPPLVIAIMVHLYRQNGARDGCLLISCVLFHRGVIVS